MREMNYFVGIFRIEQDFYAFLSEFDIRIYIGEEIPEDCGALIRDELKKAVGRNVREFKPNGIFHVKQKALKYLREHYMPQEILVDIKRVYVTL